jgi:hypothetical protein
MDAGENEYLNRIKRFVGKIEKVTISQFDIFQRIFMDVELTRGDKLMEVVSGFRRTRLEVTPCELYMNALEALKNVMPESVFDNYTRVLESEEMCEAVGYYGEWEREFERLCLLTEKLKKYRGQTN